MASRPKGARRAVSATVILAAALGGAGATPAAAAHPRLTVSAVKGLAFNYFTDISLFGGPKVRYGYGQAANPPVNTSGSSASPSTACGPGPGGQDVASGGGARATYGPATVFSGKYPPDDSQNSTAPPSGPLFSYISCQIGLGGHADASTSVTLTPPGTTWTPPGSLTAEPRPGGVGPDTFVADEVRSACTASPRGGNQASTTIVNGTIQTDDDPLTTETVPPDPPMNYTRNGQVLNDTFTIVVNEVIPNADGSITVNAVHNYLHGPTAVGDIVIGSSTCGVTTDVLPTTAVHSDFDGDGSDNVAVFRPADASWHFGPGDGLDAGPTWGFSGDVPVPGDYDRNGRTDFAVFRPSVGGWYSKDPVERWGLPPVFWGAPGDVPVPGDYDGNGTIDVAVFRPSVGGWYINGQGTVFYGMSGDIPVPGDYNGDKKTDIAVFRPSVGGWYINGQPTVFHGLSGDIPVPGDYDGDGTDDIAVYRPSVGGWYVRGAATVFYGLNGDVPVPGDYDNDAKTDIGVFRPSESTWYIIGNPPVRFGADGDIPLTLPAAIYDNFF